MSWRVSRRAGIINWFLDYKLIMIDHVDGSTPKLHTLTYHESKMTPIDLGIQSVPVMKKEDGNSVKALIQAKLQTLDMLHLSMFPSKRTMPGSHSLAQMMVALKDNGDHQEEEEEEEKGEDDSIYLYKNCGHNMSDLIMTVCMKRTFK
ncbi:hypothetical protein FSP39_001796 [Pinctada imbricata]|uniref:Uncharacterized protein n=1 Tax=Pinctada imbricata TaxID=66713 RepID=A0AA89C899_PINIB|nr:hypothetical protein FSP39_001796 [Pinctada imbricata]